MQHLHNPMFHQKYQDWPYDFWSELSLTHLDKFKISIQQSGHLGIFTLSYKFQNCAQMCIFWLPHYTMIVSKFAKQSIIAVEIFLLVGWIIQGMQKSIEIEDVLTEIKINNEWNINFLQNYQIYSDPEW